jgi:hypothetical protein
VTATSEPQPTPLIGRALLLMLGAAVSFGLMVWASGERSSAPLEADAAQGSDEPTTLDDDGRFTGPGDVWPPQPRNATEIVERPDLGPSVVTEEAGLRRLDRSAQSDERSPSQVLAADRSVQDALGDRHNLIAVEELSAGTSRLVYYSLSTNQTVDVTVTGDAVTELVLSEPGEFQPELSRAEKLAAVDLARAHWEARGDTRIDQLQGFTILTFRQDGSYHDTRMVYVSFHIDEDARPELLAWVDLVTGEVVRSEVDR